MDPILCAECEGIPWSKNDCKMDVHVMSITAEKGSAVMALLVQLDPMHSSLTVKGLMFVILNSNSYTFVSLFMP
jgi:hypothetical protein